MIISYHGESCFKIAQGDLSLVINPKSKLSADITLFTSGREDTSDKSGFVIEGPGEYEIKDIFIKGFLSAGKVEKVHTIYLITFEGMRLCFLGDLGSAKLPEGTEEAIEEVDILFVPPNAYELAVALEPGIIVPINYDPNSLSKFLKEAGETEVKPIDKLVLKKKDLEGKEGEVVVLREE